MYRILIADDEGIMREALKTIISSHYGNDCELAFAKTGRSVVEQAETFRPDIAFVDIQMPGLNGIQAIREIRKFNSTMRFVIITAFDKFDYAKEAINLGVLEYLTKPVKKATVLDVLDKIIAQIDKERRKRSDNLRIQEKLETVIPIVENGFVNAMITQAEGNADLDYYRMLLDIREKYAFSILIQFGQINEKRMLTAPVSMSMRIQNVYPQLRAVCKEFFPCIVGPILTNRMILIVFCESDDRNYNSRLQHIEQARNLMRRLGTVFEATFRAGIGNTVPLEEVRLSYTEAYRALSQSVNSVAHVDDISASHTYVDNYPVDLERQIFSNVAKANWTSAKEALRSFFSWLTMNYFDEQDNICLKVLEIVIQAEKEAFLNGGIESYGFSSRKNYLEEVKSCKDYDALEEWFERKLEEVCRKNEQKHETQSQSIIATAKEYINENYAGDLSLDEVSRSINISPYYFSKLFKEEAGQNFIEYLTEVRIGHARNLLENSMLSIKEIGITVGYGDPNYFSRIFKKQEGLTPSEYREQLKENRG